jgi:putative nucleotidyltransferase with HDIG domain
MEGATIPTWQKILAEFLVKRSILTEDQVSAHLRFFGALDRRFGQLSQMKGYLALSDVLAILEAQAQEGNQRFGEVAVAKGKMSADQVQKIAALQKNPSDLFLESLVFAERLAADRLPEVLADLRRWLADRNREAAPPTPPPQEAPRLGRDEVRSVFRRMKSIGAMPGVVQRLLALTEKPDVEMRDLEKAVVADPSMTAQLLRIVNSAAFGASRSISTVRDAIGRIGIKGLRNVALATVLLDRFKGSDRDAMRRIWLHSVLTAQWAQALAESRGLRVVAEDAFIAGLVHDVGKTVLRQFFPECSASFDERIKAGRPLDEVERDLFGQPHEDVGAYLCELWEFPPAITQAVAYHHLPPASFKAMPGVQALAGCVHGGCRLADVPLKPDDPAGNRTLLEALDPELRRMHRVEPAMADLFPRVHAKARDLAAWLS